MHLIIKINRILGEKGRNGTPACLQQVDLQQAGISKLNPERSPPGGDRVQGDNFPAPPL